MEETAAWLKAIVQGLVENPDAVDVESTKDDMGVLFVLKLDQQDAGRIVGRDGKNAKAIRTLLYSMGFKYRLRANLKIDIPDLVDEGTY